MTFNSIRAHVLLFFAVLPFAPVFAALRVITTLPDFVEVIEAVGGSSVKVESLLDGSQDPHFVDAVPSYVSKVARADVLCAVGLDLEVGWLPKVVSKSANSKLQKGGTGFCDLSTRVNVLEKAVGKVDRSMGDVHAEGNPHYNLSPSAMAQAAQEVQRVLTALEPTQKELFKKNTEAFIFKMKTLKAGILQKLKPLQGKKLLQYHKEFSYFFHEYELKDIGALEEKSGVPPSAARIANVSKRAQQDKVVLLLASNQAPLHSIKKFTELSAIPYLQIPIGVHLAAENFNNIEKLQEHIVALLLNALPSQGVTP